MTKAAIVGPDGGDVVRLGPITMRILEDGGTTGHRLGIGEIDALEAEAVAIQHEILGMQAAIVERDAARIGRAAGARVATAGRCHDGEDLGSVVDDVIERRLNGVGCRLGSSV